MMHVYKYFDLRCLMRGAATNYVWRNQRRMLCLNHAVEVLEKMDIACILGVAATEHLSNNVMYCTCLISKN